MRNIDMEEARHATWLELFYDLAFVVAISVIGHELASNKSWEGLLIFIALFIPVWWAWLGDTFYNNRFDPEDHGHQVFTLLQMIGIVGLAVFAHNGLEAGFTGFVLSFVWIRLILAILSYRAGSHDKSAKSLMYYNGNTILLALVFWILAIFFPAPWRYVLVVIGLVIDLVAPMLVADRQRSVPINVSHLVERFGLFTVILLGEVILLGANATIEAGITIRELILTAIGIALAFCIWWLYFENENGHEVVRNFFSEDAQRKVKNTFAGYVWVYAHLPFSMGLIASAIGIEEIIALGPEAAIPRTGILFLSFGLVAIVASLGFMEAAAISRNKNFKLEGIKLSLPFFSVLFVLAVSYSSMAAYPIKLFAALAIILFVQVITQELIEHELDPDHH